MIGRRGPPRTVDVDPGSSCAFEFIGLRHMQVRQPYNWLQILEDANGVPVQCESTPYSKERYKYCMSDQFVKKNTFKFYSSLTMSLNTSQ